MKKYKEFTKLLKYQLWTLNSNKCPMLDIQKEILKKVFKHKIIRIYFCCNKILFKYFSVIYLQKMRQNGK